MTDHYLALFHKSDKAKIEYINYHNIKVIVNINSDEMYLSFPNESHSKVIHFDNRLPSTQASKDYFMSLGISAIYS